jgi:hypothetical protein
MEGKKDWGKQCTRYEHPKTICSLNTPPWKFLAGKFKLRYEVTSPQFFPF